MKLIDRLKNCWRLLRSREYAAVFDLRPRGRMSAEMAKDSRLLELSAALMKLSAEELRKRMEEEHAKARKLLERLERLAGDEYDEKGGEK